MRRSIGYHGIRRASASSAGVGRRAVSPVGRPRPSGGGWRGPRPSRARIGIAKKLTSAQPVPSTYPAIRSPASPGTSWRSASRTAPTPVARRAHRAIGPIRQRATAMPPPTEYGRPSMLRHTIATKATRVPIWTVAARAESVLVLGSRSSFRRVIPDRAGQLHGASEDGWKPRRPPTRARRPVTALILTAASSASSSARSSTSTKPLSAGPQGAGRVDAARRSARHQPPLA